MYINLKISRKHWLSNFFIILRLLLVYKVRSIYCHHNSPYFRSVFFALSIFWRYMFLKKQKLSFEKTETNWQNCTETMICRSKYLDIRRQYEEKAKKSFKSRCNLCKKILIRRVVFKKVLMFLYRNTQLLEKVKHVN